LARLDHDDRVPDFLQFFLRKLDQGNLFCVSLFRFAVSQ
jgi:hypothetical protein